jgi:hypothetical protein
MGGKEGQMLKVLKSAMIAAALLSAACAAQAQTAPLEAVTLDRASWMAGRWIGEGLGGEMEEVWSAPAGGQMVGHFRMIQSGAPVFYEFMIMDVADGGIRMRLKHFNPDYTAWEDRETWVTFTPVSSSESEIVTSALHITRTGADTMTMVLRLRQGESVQEHTLNFRRAPL